MKKKLVRLTEDDLHSIIKESVNNILSELDWKTYANAGFKRDNVLKYGETDDRVNKLLNYSKDVFNKDYGYDDGKDKYSMIIGFDDEDNYPTTTHTKKYMAKDGTYENEFPLQTNIFDPDEETIKKSYRNQRGNADARNAVKRGNDELRKYMYGNYEYEKGKGWKNKRQSGEKFNNDFKWK